MKRGNHLSFQKKREDREIEKHWIPAFAGMAMYWDGFHPTGACSVPTLLDFQTRAWVGSKRNLHRFYRYVEIATVAELTRNDTTPATGFPIRSGMTEPPTPTSSSL